LGLKELKKGRKNGERTVVGKRYLLKQKAKKKLIKETKQRWEENL
jgi:hypothetical protein